MNTHARNPRAQVPQQANTPRGDSRLFPGLCEATGLLGPQPHAVPRPGQPSNARTRVQAHTSEPLASVRVRKRRPSTSEHMSVRTPECLLLHVPAIPWAPHCMYRMCVAALPRNAHERVPWGAPACPLGHQCAPACIPGVCGTSPTMPVCTPGVWAYVPHTHGNPLSTGHRPSA